MGGARALRNLGQEKILMQLWNTCSIIMVTLGGRFYAYFRFSVGALTFELLACLSLRLVDYLYEETLYGFKTSLRQMCKPSIGCANHHKSPCKTPPGRVNHNSGG